MEKLELDMTARHALDEDTRTITLRRCWSVVFDCNGNAPADATVASFATKKLAVQAHSLWAGLKDEDKDFSIVVGGVRHFEPPQYSVEGYNWDSFYKVEEDWCEDKDIFTSLEQIATLCDSSDSTDLPDGIYVEDAESDEDDEG